jgi:hypothetical protein
MALNFPPQAAGDPEPTDGTYWTDPYGQQWVYKAATDSWVGLATSSGGIVYRGGINLTVDPDTQYANIISGNMFTVITGSSSVDNALYPGLGGSNIQPGEDVIYDGANWQYQSVLVPAASETVSGIIELATQSEVNAGTDAERAVVPSTLNGLLTVSYQSKLPAGSNGQVLGYNNGIAWQDLSDSTTTVKGITRYATTAESNAGEEQNAAVTPNSLSGILTSITGLNTNYTELSSTVATNTTNIATNTSDIAALQTEVASSSVPTGSIFWFASSSVPNGYLVCNGSVISRDDHPALFDLIGSTYGSAGRLPDLRGEFIRGWDAARSVDSNRTFGSSQTDEFGEHRHTTNIDNSTVELSGGGGYSMGPGNRPQQARGFGQMSSEGGVETRPRNIALLPCIKT